jgi:hypothetical protein
MTNNYNPVPPRVWSRVQNRCSVFAYSNNYDPVYIPSTGQYTTALVAQYEGQMLQKSNILQYKKNSSCLSKNQKLSLISKGYWCNRRKCYAAQTQTYSNPNTSSLQRVNYVTYPYPNNLVGKPNNPSGPFQVGLPNPFGCPTTTIVDGGSLLCNTIVQPCSNQVIETTYTRKCYPTTDSDVPGAVTYLCWKDGTQTWYPRQRYIMTNSLNKWPVNYKGLKPADKPCVITSL